MVHDSSSNDGKTPQDGDAAISALSLGWIKTAGPPSRSLKAMAASNQAQPETAINDASLCGR